MTPLDDLFSTDESRAEAQLEKVVTLNPADISDFPNHPFKVKQDEAMAEMVDSVKQYGVLVPALVRPKADGGYEMVAGHRRKCAATLASITEMPCIVRNLTDDEATIIMVDSNLQRETILPSEKAFAYKMKLEAMKRQGQRSDLTSTPLVSKSRSNEELGQKNGDSRSDQVLYIDRVIDRVDKKLIEKLPKMDILFRFPNLYPGTRTVIVLKQPKTEGSIRTVYIPETVAKKLEKLREMQMKLKLELGDDGYMDYGLIICQANGRPIMTEHLNKRFKEVLIGLNDPTINVDNVVFHSLRHTSTGVKLRLSKGDLKAVQGDGGWNSPDMVTKRYAHILDEDRRRLADEMEQSFYKGKAEEAPVAAAPALDAEALASLLASNPELLKKALESVQLANNT